MDKLNDIVSTRGGEIVSVGEFYWISKHEIQCNKCGTIWSVLLSNLHKGSWCPTCAKNGNIREELCREVFKELLAIEVMDNCRPNFMEGLELDGYCSVNNIKIAFEHNGIQHYKFVERFHKSEDNFHKQQERDAKKERLCKEQNINLVIIPYTVPEKKLKKFIYDKVSAFMKLREFDLEKFLSCNDFKIRAIKNNGRVEKQMERLEIHVKANEGMILSGIYTNNCSMFTMKCNVETHKPWNVRYFDIINKGRWCPECGGTMKLTIEKIKPLIEDRGYKLVSTEYINSETRLNMICPNQHTCEISWDNFKQNRNCAKCREGNGASSRRLNIDVIQSFLESRGCSLIDGKYQNNMSEITIKCKYDDCPEITAYYSLLKNRKYICMNCNDGEKYGTPIVVKEEIDETDVLMMEEKYNYDVIISNYKGKSKTSLVTINCLNDHTWKCFFNKINPTCAECDGMSAPQQEQYNKLIDKFGDSLGSLAYYNQHTPITINCEVCGKYTRTWNAINKENVCKCFGTQSYNPNVGKAPNAKKSTVDIKNEIERMGLKIDESKYPNGMTYNGHTDPIHIICPNGHDPSSIIGVIRRSIENGGNGCRDCGRTRTVTAVKASKEEKLKNVDSDLVKRQVESLGLEFIQINKTKVEVRCPDHDVHQEILIRELDKKREIYDRNNLLVYHLSKCPEKNTKRVDHVKDVLDLCSENNLTFEMCQVKDTKSQFYVICNIHTENRMNITLDEIRRRIRCGRQVCAECR